MKEIYRLTIPVPINGKDKEVSCKCTPHMNGSFIAPQDFEALAPDLRQPFLLAIRKKYTVIGTASDGFRVFQPQAERIKYGKA
jgi:hypothetical protein